MGEVEEIWSDDVDLEEMTAVDFERRGQSMAVYDKFGEVTHIIEALSDYWDVDHSATIDRSIRIYLSYIHESGEVDVKVEEMKSLIPPSDWIKEFEPIDIEEDGNDNGSERHYFATTVTVNEMVKTAVDKGVADSASKFTIDALKFVIGQ